MNIRAKLLPVVGGATLALGLGACGDGGLNGFGQLDGSFAGPPQGSSLAGKGLEPLIGATPFTFEPESEQITGFSVDHWYLSGGYDTNDQFQGTGIPLADIMDSLKDADFEQFTCGNCIRNSPWAQEANFVYPMVVSFLAQWFLRNADNTRPTTIDVFGRQVFSDSALDISFITSPVVESYDMAGNLISVVHNTNFPNRDFAGGAIRLPLSGWTSPPIGDPSLFPPSQMVFTAKQFNRLGLIRVRDVSSGQSGSTIGGGTSFGSGGAGSIALGGSIADDAQNSHVESMCSVPSTDAITGAPIAVRQPIGVFSDNYAIEYRLGPVQQPPQADPTAVPPIPPASLSDAKLEEATIEFARHMAAIHANLIGQAIGLTPGSPGTLMDPAMVQLENRYEYRFSADDIETLATKRLPGRFR